VRIFTPVRLVALGLVLGAVAIAALVLLLVPSNEYIFLPDRAHPVTPLVDVPGGREPRNGGIYFVDVVVRKATLLEKLFGGLHTGADLFPASNVNPPGVNDAQRLRIDREDMLQSQKVAAAVALRAAGRRVVMHATGVKVEDVFPGEPAVGKLEPDDIILAVGGKRVTGPVDLQRDMRRYRVGAVVRFTLLRGTRKLIEAVQTVASPDRPPHPFVGIQIAQAVNIRLPVRVRIDAGGVGGPSAGLAFALDVYQQLGHDVDHGHKIAATGELFPDGSVGQIGGVKQKTYGAREAGVDAFLVPAGDNAREAQRYAGGLRIIPVKSFTQALRALATSFASA
jgi:PDZ domain-containing protein